MSYLLFIDESGHDLKESPYEVLAGICVEDRDLWNLICAVQDAEERFFGQRVSSGLLELKANKFLNRKQFRLAKQLPGMPSDDRARLAGSCLRKGAEAKGKTDRAPVTRAELTAQAQSKIAYVDFILDQCAKFGVKAFASIVDRDAKRPEKNFLRKDYAYLFERYFYFLQDQTGRPQGIVVFDELDHTLAHKLLEQMSVYFRETATGAARASSIIPEPFFVHSHLTTGVQIADLIAYITAWGVRIRHMEREAREELGPLAEKVKDLRFRTSRDGYETWSFVVLNDLRPREGRNGRQ